MNAPKQTVYSNLSKLLHWAVAALILVQYVLVELAERAEQTGETVQQLGILANHKSIGITVLMLAIIRLLVRAVKPAPALPSSMPDWQATASKLSHILLYGLLFALPISGWLMSSASAYSVSWFNLVPLPDFIAANEEHAQCLSDIHDILSDVLIVVVVIHIAAALKHHFINRDTVLTRMVSRSSLALFSVLILGSVLALGNLVNFAWNKPTDTSITTSINNTVTDNALSKSSLAVWQIDYANSHIRFTGEQAGAPFTGVWQQWQANIQFNADNLAEARFDVSIDIGSVNSKDKERDDTIRSVEFFDAEQFATARFYAANVSKTTSTEKHSFTADGTLTMKGITQPVKFVFEIQKSPQQATLNGKATLNRHQWNLGIGDWAHPTWVGSEVEVEVLVKTTLN